MSHMTHVSEHKSFNLANHSRAEDLEQPWPPPLVGAGRQRDCSAVTRWTKLRKQEHKTLVRLKYLVLTDCYYCILRQYIIYYRYYHYPFQMYYTDKVQNTNTTTPAPTPTPTPSTSTATHTANPTATPATPVHYCYSYYYCYSYSYYSYYS